MQMMTIIFMMVCLGLGAGFLYGWLQMVETCRRMSDCTERMFNKYEKIVDKMIDDNDITL